MDPLNKRGTRLAALPLATTSLPLLAANHQEWVVYLIIATAVFFALRGIYRLFTGKGGKTCHGKGKGCSGCNSRADKKWQP
ncbi:MAG: FeoB-associated Cys-rich membrane protein [Odoribacteraceae bacterium]|nr:FeoB-associated Cys-rich membrane protein [Odoribacteraceae bacterium]